MNILTETINRSIITLQFEQDLEEGIDDITPFVRSLEKLKKIINEPGFQNKFTKEEKEIWNTLCDNILEDDTVQGVQQIVGDRVYIQE